MEEVLIIESRNADDHYNNRQEGLILAKVLELGKIKTKYFEVLDERYFIRTLKKAKKLSVKYVHISCHGLKDGFQLTNGPFITWQRFAEIATTLLEGKCLVFSSCLVGKGAEQLFSFQPNFCNAIVAPTREIGWDESLVAYSAFYYRAKNKDTAPDSDVTVMNHIVGAGTFRLISRGDTYVVGN